MEIRENIILAPYTTFGIGGPARYFCEVGSVDDLKSALKFSKENNMRLFILGGGSNVLVSDKGFDGLVIKLEPSDLKIEGGRISVFAGNNRSDFVRKTMEKGFSGLEFGANIPGTVGGAIYGNAGAYGQGAGDFVEKIEIIICEE